MNIRYLKDYNTTMKPWKKIDLSHYWSLSLGYGLQKLYNYLERNTTVKRLKFSKAKHDYDGLAKVLEKNSTITHLDLSDCNIGRNELEKIAIALKINQNLKIKYLDLSYNKIDYKSEKGLKILADFLISNSSITHLNLSGNENLGGKYENESIHSVKKKKKKNSVY